MNNLTDYQWLFIAWAIMSAAFIFVSILFFSYRKRKEADIQALQGYLDAAQEKAAEVDKCRLDQKHAEDRYGRLVTRFHDINYHNILYEKILIRVHPYINLIKHDPNKLQAYLDKLSSPKKRVRKKAAGIKKPE